MNAPSKTRSNAERSPGKPTKGKARGKLTPLKIRDDAAGVDIGATEIYVAVAPDKDPEPVRRFATFTQDLLEAASWLARCGVKTVAMESTGVYWIPLFQLLEAQSLEVFLVNAQHLKNVPGRKSDVSDSQWIQQLHSMGLLNGSFRPPRQVCALRAILRHRTSITQLASQPAGTAHAEIAGPDECADSSRAQRHHRNEWNGNA
jgi:transposase